MSANVRSYGSYLNKSIQASQSAVDRANSVHDPYYKESSIILLSNSWELFSKALLIKHGGEKLIYESGTNKEISIKAEKAVNKLKNLGYISETQAIPIQQLISLRNEAIHSILNDIPDEIVFHLEYYAIRYLKELIEINFKQYSKFFKRNYLSINFEGVVTYADKVKKLVSKAKKSRDLKSVRLAYLLERGTVFNGGEYIKQSDFNKALLDKRNKRPMYKLKLGEYSRKSEMIVVVPIQAPSGTVADIKLTKSRSHGNITVNFEKRASDDDYPYLTTDLGVKIGRSRYYIQQIIKDLKIKENPEFHQNIRTGKKSSTNKYSEPCLSYLKEFLTNNPDYVPKNSLSKIK